MKKQGWRKGVAEVANEMSIFGKLHHLSPILGAVKDFATIVLVGKYFAPSIFNRCAGPEKEQ